MKEISAGSPTLKTNFLNYLRTAWKICVVHHSEGPKSLVDKWQWKAEVDAAKIAVSRKLVDKEYSAFLDKEIPDELMKPKGKSRPKVNIRVCC